MKTQLLFAAFRNKDNYNRAVQDVQQSEEQTVVMRVKFDSLLNKLQYFHVCSGLPPCLGHDLFAGVLNYDVAN